MKEKYLPVGTVVLLQNGTKRVMINGFCSIDSEEPTKIYDYSGVLDHMGLIDDEETEFKAKLKEILAAEANKPQA